MAKVRSYHQDWDEYVDDWQQYALHEPTYHGERDLAYPGDEWGNPESWKKLADNYLRAYLPKDSSGYAVEIGSGAGKYTLEVAPAVSKLICFDVSKNFVEVAQSRVQQAGLEEKVFFEILHLLHCYEIKDALARQDLAGKIDLFFSIDSMVHVELHTLFAYFLNAALTLKVGGHLVMTVASCANDAGFTKLLNEMPWVYGGMRPSRQFYYLSQENVRFCLTRLGFDLVHCEEGRDILFVAKKTPETENMMTTMEQTIAGNVAKVAQYVSETQMSQPLTSQERMSEPQRPNRGIRIFKALCSRWRRSPLTM